MDNFAVMICICVIFAAGSAIAGNADKMQKDDDPKKRRLGYIVAIATPIVAAIAIVWLIIFSRA